MKHATRFCVFIALLLAPCVAEAHPSYGLVMDSKGNLFFSDEGTSVVWRVDPRGHSQIVVRNVHCHFLSIDSGDNVYGEDVQYESSNNTYISRVWKLSPSGRVVIVMPSTADVPDVSRYTFADPWGRVYALEVGRQTTNLQTWSPGAGFRTVFGGPKMVRDGPARTARAAWPRAFAFTAPGAAYFADGALVRGLAPNGDVTTLAEIRADPRAPKQKPSVMGLAVTSGGDVLAADIGTHRIWRLTPATRRVSAVAVSDATWLPSAVAERGGTIFVLEHGEYRTAHWGFVRVRKLSPDGRATTVATVGERPNY